MNDLLQQGVAPPPAQPTQACRRFTYRTAWPNPTAQNAFENFASIVQQAAYLLSLEVVVTTFDEIGTTSWVLLYDKNLIPGAMTAADFVAANPVAPISYGPIPQSGLMVRDFEELTRIAGPGDDLLLGLPFDNGIVAVLSSTPRVATLIESAAMSVFARGRR